VTVLLSGGANMKAQDQASVVRRENSDRQQDRMTPLHYAGHKRHVELVTVLLEASADIRPQDRVSDRCSSMRESLLLFVWKDSPSYSLLFL
jgi:ankyrin repeat protein